MIDAAWLLFVVASLVLIATPGQDMILVMSRSVAQGGVAGVVTAAGVSIGLVGHTVLATLGLGAILRTSEWLFLALKFVGAAYLIYLGIGLLRTKRGTLRWMQRRRGHWESFSSMACQPVEPQGGDLHFAFQAFARRPHPTITVFVLGLAFAGLTFIVKATVGMFAGTLSAWLRARPGVLAWVYRCSGAILLGLGVRLAFERR
jgi:threonine/homoserine/homoserine lactone efflux protein